MWEDSFIKYLIRETRAHFIHGGYEIRMNFVGRWSDIHRDVSRSAARRVCDHRGPGVKLLFRPTFTPAAAGVTFDWTATLNWFRLKPLPPSPKASLSPLASSTSLVPFHRCRSPPPPSFLLFHALSSFLRLRRFVLPFSVLVPFPHTSPAPAMIRRLHLFF